VCASWSAGTSAGSVSARPRRRKLRAVQRSACKCRPACRSWAERLCRAEYDKVPSMYEMQGTSPGLAASGQPVAWPSRRERAARQSQEPALGSGCPAPPTSRSRPRAAPVSNGESISTASARDRARPVTHLFPAFFVSTGCPQNMTGYPHPSVVFHCPLHRSSTGYRALPRGTLGCLHLRRVLFSPAFPNSISRVPGAAEIIRSKSAVRR
jgi:hypothetical protein